MIGRLHGKLLEKNPPQILIDVSGVGYEVDVQCQHFAISRKSAESSRSTRTSSCVKMLSFFTALPHSPNALCSVRSSRFPASVQKLRWHSFRASRSISLKTLSIGERPDSLPKSPASAKRLQNDWCWSSKVSSQAPAQRQRQRQCPDLRRTCRRCGRAHRLGVFRTRSRCRDEEAPRGLHGERRPASGTQVTHALSLTGVSAPRRCAMLILTTAFSFSPRCPKTPPTA